MNQEINSLLQNIFNQDPNLLLSFCNLNILAWKSRTLEKAFILQIGKTRYISYERTDRNGETYWKFKPLTNEKEAPASNSDSSEVKKFQERVAKTEELNQSK